MHTDPECLKSPITCIDVMFMPAVSSLLCLLTTVCMLFHCLRCTDKVVLCYTSRLYTYHTLYTWCCCLYLWGEDMMNDIDKYVEETLQYWLVAYIFVFGILYWTQHETMEYNAIWYNVPATNTFCEAYVNNCNQQLVCTRLQCKV